MAAGVYAPLFFVFTILIDQHQIKVNAEIHERMVTRENSTMCLPVYNCDENTYVKSCQENGTRETCERCGSGEVQPNLISSFDGDEDRQCFRPRDIYSCNDRDTVHSRTPYGVNWCTIRCKCNINKCFWGSPCICERKATSCGVGEELDVDTGECKPCKKGSYKDTSGCDPCRLNATWFMRNSVEHEMTTNNKSRIRLYNTISVEETTLLPTSSSSASSIVSIISSEKSKEKEDEQKSRIAIDFRIIIAVAITALFMVSMGVILAYFIIIKENIITPPCLKKRRRDAMGHSQPVAATDKVYVPLLTAGPHFSGRTSDKEDHCDTNI